MGTLPSKDETRRTLALLRSQSALINGVLDARERLATLRPFLEETVTTPVRIAALEAAVPFVLYLGDRTEACRLADLAEVLEAEAEGLESRITIGRVLGIGYWLSRRQYALDGVGKKLALLAEECHKEGLDNAATWLLHTTTGSVHACIGDYERAIQSFKGAYRIARKLGGEEKTGSTATSLAICLGRTGEYRLQAEWAQQAGLCFGNSTWRRELAMYYGAFAHFMLGEDSKALDLCEPLIGHTPLHRPAWADQCVPLMAADVLLATGHKGEATSVALQGLDRSGLQPLTGSYAGMVARWIARIAVEGVQRENAAGVLAGLTDELQTHDAIDQAEILSARLWLEEQTGRTWRRGRDLLAQALSQLPPAVEHQLRRLQCLG